MNNGTCMNSNINETELFKCECQSNYFGVYCEHEIDLCQNKTCSDHGYCAFYDSVPVCKCFTGYNGIYCEQEEASTKLVHRVQLTSILICAICIGSTILIVISSDIWNLFISSDKKFREIYRHHPEEIHFKYYPE